MGQNGGVPPILFVALQTGAASNGGIASIGAIIESLSRFRPVVLTNRESDVTRRWRALGIEVSIIGEAASAGWRRAPLRTAATYVRWFFAIRGLLRRTRARIVHANDPLAFQLAFAAVRSVPRAQIVLNIRDTIGSGRAAPRKKYERLFRAASHTLFLSRDMRERWGTITPAALENSTATYSMVDFERFAPQPLSAVKPRVVLVSGVVCDKKGQLPFLREVAPRLADAGIASWLSGDFALDSEPYARACAKAAAPLGDMVRFLGYRSDVHDLIARAHVVAVTSRYEGLMRTMIEAMAMGRPVVSTDVASAREMLEMPGRSAGAVFADDRLSDMAETIIGLCRDEDTNRQLGANGHAIARKYFDSARVLQAYESTYDRLLSTSRT